MRSNWPLHPRGRERNPAFAQYSHPAVCKISLRSSFQKDLKFLFAVKRSTAEARQQLLYNPQKLQLRRVVVLINILKFIVQKDCGLAHDVTKK